MIDSPLLSIPAAARLLGCCPDTLRGEIRSGALPVVRVGRRRKVERAAMEAFLARRREGGAVAAKREEWVYRNVWSA